jgi:hypothetical protein
VSFDSGVSARRYHDEFISGKFRRFSRLRQKGNILAGPSFKARFHLPPGAAPFIPLAVFGVFTSSSQRCNVVVTIRAQNPK